MRHMVTSALYFALILFAAHGTAASAPTIGVVGVKADTTALVLEPKTWPFFTARAQNATEESSIPNSDKSDRTQSPNNISAYDAVCQTLDSAALSHELPLEFLTRLIWQESRFDAKAVSPKGAQG